MKKKERDVLLKRLQQEQILSKRTVDVKKTEEPIKKLDLESQLFVAILLSPLEIIKDLLKEGADPNATNKKGTTLLQLALVFKREDVATLLEEYGAIPSFYSNKKLKK